MPLTLLLVLQLSCIGVPGSGNIGSFGVLITAGITGAAPRKVFSDVEEAAETAAPSSNATRSSTIKGLLDPVHAKSD